MLTEKTLFVGKKYVTKKDDIRIGGKFSGRCLSEYDNPLPEPPTLLMIENDAVLLIWKVQFDKNVSK